MLPQDQTLEVWGELACFTRPELKVERFSYPVITPSAARGIYDAIYCKPREFRWQITCIEVTARSDCEHRQPSYIALRRNEVKDRAPSPRIIAQWMDGRAEPEPIYADGDKSATGSDKKGRTQRQTMALKNVRYRLHGQIRPWPGFEGSLRGLEAQFRRRAASGKCIYQPYFGCREFPAYFELVEPDAHQPEPLLLDEDIGPMVYDVFDLSRPGDAYAPVHVSLFDASIRGGVMHVPDFASDAVLKPGGKREVTGDAN